MADGLTKETPEAGDTLRGTLRQGFYQLASEESALKVRAEEKQKRLQRGQERAAQASVKRSKGTGVQEENATFYISAADSTQVSGTERSLARSHTGNSPFRGIKLTPRLSVAL